MSSAVSLSSPFTDRRVVIALATLCCLLWGSAVPVLKIGYELLGIPPGDPPSMLLFAGLRFTLSGLLLLGVSTLARRSIALPPRGFAQVGPARAHLHRRAVPVLLYRRRPLDRRAGLDHHLDQHLLLGAAWRT